MRVGWMLWLWLWAHTAVAGPREPLEAQLRTGDIVLHTSRSRQSQAIQAATHSPLSHVGLVEVTPQGAWVVEAVQPVQRVAFATWKARGVRGHILVLRPRGLDAELRQRALDAAKAHLGKPYDWRFGWGDEAMYCSELVRKAYARGAGVEYGRMERLGSLDVAGLRAQLRERYGRDVPLEQQLVTPASLALDERLMVVHSDFPTVRDMSL
ncbi:YiiX family permuted papain-like enzyme [Myxococcus sp. K15C18031901]|uniref:YiiX family permuted papain-like enzyme n=1 Tax=Myxococcus dinghuensis TaxID=2906761 RepID=UPI0020A71859|nr:YiiX family permuted papain-like enzyme [Myxococcus dinghuensis]MCP3100664.1 YiiX family permuted papain-like enzyme [Myxococcus dinghuensis]